MKPSKFLFIRSKFQSLFKTSHPPQQQRLPMTRTFITKIPIEHSHCSCRDYLPRGREYYLPPSMLDLDINYQPIAQKIVKIAKSNKTLYIGFDYIEAHKPELKPFVIRSVSLTSLLHFNSNRSDTPPAPKQYLYWSDPATSKKYVGFGKFQTDLILAGGQITEPSPTSNSEPPAYNKDVLFFDTRTTATGSKKCKSTSAAAPTTVAITEMNYSKSIFPLVIEACGKLYVLSQVIDTLTEINIPRDRHGDLHSNLSGRKKQAFEAYDPETKQWENLPTPLYIDDMDCQLHLLTDKNVGFMMPYLGYVVMDGKIFVSVPKTKTCLKSPLGPSDAVCTQSKPHMELSKNSHHYLCFSYDLAAKKWAPSELFDGIGHRYGFTEQAFLFSDDILICVCGPVLCEVFAYQLADGKVVKCQSLTKGFGITECTLSAHLVDIGEGLFCLVHTDRDKSHLIDVRLNVTLTIFHVEKGRPVSDKGGKVGKFLECWILRRFNYTYNSPNLEVRGCFAI